MIKKSILFFVLLGLSACSDNSDKVLHGYVEVEPIYLAANAGGYLKQLLVQRGGEAKAGQLLFTLDNELEHLQVIEEEARVAQAKAQAEDLAKGKRDDEIAAIQASLSAAQATAEQSKREFQRQQKLFSRQLIAESTVDIAHAKRDSDQAHLVELQAQLRVANLAARDQQRIAAQANITVNEAQRAQRHWQLGQRSLKAPISAHVEQTFYRVGEWVPAGAPVIELLDAQAMKIRFYVPEPELNHYAPGTKIKILCDNCQPLSGVVTYQASEAEFTPPVIYSRENRAKLVYLVEAKPVSTAQLRPGQPIDVIK